MLNALVARCANTQTDLNEVGTESAAVATTIREAEAGAAFAAAATLVLAVYFSSAPVAAGGHRAGFHHPDSDL